VRGKPVADLIPHRADATEAVAAAVAALQATPRIHGVSDAEVAGFVREGRL
jgi:antitoxin (DNA-binding transcriptional repressor) of toxin-antitoxin stability system